MKVRTAGGRVLVTSSEGRLMAFDPVSGDRLAEVIIDGGASRGPIVAGGTIYVLSDDARLYAFR